MKLQKNKKIIVIFLTFFIQIAFSKLAKTVDNKQIYSGTLYYTYILKKCGSSWSVSPVYQKAQAFGYHAFKQDNNWNRDVQEFQFIDAQAIKNDDRNTKSIDDSRTWNMFSRQTAYHNLNPCSIPGACSSPGGLHTWVIFIIEVIMNLVNRTAGKYYIGVPSRSSFGDYAYNGNPSMAVYGLKPTGYKIALNNQGRDLVDAYVLTANGGQKNMIAECAGDDLWFENWYDESFIFFKYNKYNRGTVWIYSPNKLSNGTNDTYIIDKDDENIKWPDDDNEPLNFELPRSLYDIEEFPEEVLEQPNQVILKIKL